MITTTKQMQEWGVDVSKAMALEEITLDVVKLLRSYFSLRECPTDRVLVVRCVFFRLNPTPNLTIPSTPQ
jgi:hypothetical protein